MSDPQIDLFNSASLEAGSLNHFTIDEQITIVGFGLAAGESITFEMVALSSPARADSCDPCHVPGAVMPEALAWQPLMCCGDCNGYSGPVKLTSANPVVVLNAPTRVRIRAVYNGFVFGGAPLTSMVYAYPSNIGSIMPSMQGCCPPPVVVAPPLPPVTATISPCPTPACFTWGGTQYSSIVAFVSDIKALVTGATYNPTTCTFSAPAGSVFPNLAVVACVPVVVPPTPPVYCPSFRLDVCGCGEIGFAFRAGDSTDPAATVPLLACDGTTIGLMYPAAGVGHTVAYEEGGVVLGYLQNQSACAPELQAVTNVFTTVAAPTVVLPAPTVASQVLNANDAIVTTMTNGTVFTTPLSNC
jgi:hypothetical protein